jgi:hypothetical protein
MVLNVSLDNVNKNCRIEEVNAGVALATASIPNEDIAIFIHFICDNLDHKLYKE